MVMNEDISRLMDDDGDEATLARVCQAGREPLATWACYHLIGDSLRGTAAPVPGFADRFARRLAAEPTVLAPQQRVRARPATWAWAAAASVAAVGVVGLAAWSLTESPATALAKAREAGTVRAAQVRPQGLPADYLLAHQEYSPATAMQGVGPYLRAVAAPTGDGQP
jgi:sigma-E factor negative regulatory protein RseA